jgi:Na+/melibiose symporter-like transporter
MCNALVNLIVSVVFPTFVTLLSGGQGGDKRLGRGRAFLFFAATGTIMSVVLVRIFKTWEEVEAEKKAAAELAEKRHALHLATAV